MANGVIKLPLSIVGPLWTNPNPTASFAAQTVALDLSGYDGVIVQTKRSDGDNHRLHHIVFKGYLTHLTMPLGNPFIRDCTMTDTGVTFGNGFYFTSFAGSGTATANTTSIPTAIWGFKGIVTP